MLGEESHKATLDSSAGDNRVVCAVIYAVWHGEVALAAWHRGCLPHGKEMTAAHPWLARGFLFTVSPAYGRKVESWEVSPY